MKTLLIALFTFLATSTWALDLMVYSTISTNKVTAAGKTHSIIVRGYTIVDTQSDEAMSVSYFSFGGTKYYGYHTNHIHISEVTGPANTKITAWSEVFSGLGNNGNFFTSSSHGRGLTKVLTLPSGTPVRAATTMTFVSRNQSEGPEISSLGQGSGVFTYSRTITADATTRNDTLFSFIKRNADALADKGYQFQPAAY